MIGIGIDLVDIDRIRKVLARTPGMVTRLFTETERAYSDAARDPAERYAARFAAKEAVLKALGVGWGAVDWHDIEVVRNGSGAPELKITGRAEALATKAGISEWKLTMTHTKNLAEAMVVAL